MARAFSTSVFAPLVISAAVAFTMTSVGKRCVGRRKWRKSAALACCVLRGRETSTATSFVATRLVRVKTGFAPARNSHAAIPSAFGLRAIILSAPPPALYGFVILFWNGVDAITGA